MILRFLLLVCVVPLALVKGEEPCSTPPVPQEVQGKGLPLDQVINLRAKQPKDDDGKEEKILDKFGRGLIVPKDLDARIKLYHRRNIKRLAALPKATEKNYDLRALGFVPPIKNQGNCGSCWDFAGVAAAEGAYIKAGKGTKDSVNWSEQCVLDCGRNGGCNGDWPETTLEMCKNSGLANTVDYPYKATPGTCRTNVPHTNTIDDYGYVGSSSGIPSVQAMKDALKAYGTLSVAVAADNAFSNYRIGLFKGSGSRSINHAVNLVGWSDDASVPSGGYWILRNSWGTSWGMDGYMWIAYGANQVGYGAMFAVVEGVTPPTPPDPPVPPVPPVPPPTPGKGFTGSLNYKDGLLVSVTTGPVSIEDELRTAGINLILIADVMKLLTDIKNKAGRDVILADIAKIFAHFAAP